MRGPTEGPPVASTIVERCRASLLVLTLLALTAAPAASQAGISLSVTPTAERIYWADDLALEDAWYYGGRASLGFGRFVALQGYYVESGDASLPGVGDLETARRYGGEAVFTFADRRLTPFLRLGAGISEFGVGGGAETQEILTATGGAGIRVNLFERLETSVFVQDVVFRAGSASPIVAAGAVADGASETFHNLSVGAGVNLHLAGPTRQEATDAAFEGGIHGLASPVELFAGEVRWDDAIPIGDVRMGGARIGIDFGPFVGLRGYYFGSLEDDLNDFTDYFGYGAEGRFNLTPGGRTFQPFVVLGGGRIHFPPAVATAAGFEDDKKWNALFGGGVGLGVTDRLRLEVAARDLVLSRSQPENTVDPDQLFHSWLFTGELRFAVGGILGEPRRTDPDPERVPAVEAEAAPSPAETPARSTRDEALVREIRALRAEVDSLRGQIRRQDREVANRAAPMDTAAAPSSPAGAETAADAAPDPGRTAPRTIEVPVPEEGVIYIQFGTPRPGGAPLMVAPRAPAEDSATALVDALSRLLAEEETRRSAETGAEPATATPAPALSDSARALLSSLQAELQAIRAAPAQAPAAATTTGEAERLRQLELRIVERLEELESELRALRRSGTESEPTRVRVEVAEPSGSVVPAAPRRSRGVLRGDPVGFYRVSPEIGASLQEPNQLLLGVRADIGSALGGSIRLVPELMFGVTEGTTWNANAHLEWPAPLRVAGFQPWLGAGLGLLGDGSIELLVPNLLAGLSYPLGSVDAFGTLQGLDLFDETRLAFGVRTRPPAFLRFEPVPVAPVEIPGEASPAPPPPAPAPARDTAGAVEEAPAPPADPTPAAAPADDSLPPPPAPPEPPLEEVLLGELRPIALAPAVTDVRRTDRGVAVVLGGPELFRVGGARLSDVPRSTLRRLSELLVRRATLRLSVEGHTDATGPAAANQRLARARAEAVRDALVALGIASDRLVVTGFGESRPVADNETAEGRALNRRVELVFLTPP